MEKTWKPTTAGILCIVSGAIQAIGGIVVGVIGGSVAGLAAIPGIGSILAAIAIPLIIIGIVAIVGGIYALRRKVWGLALAGCICSLIGPWLLGILAIIFVAMGKNEFE
ncbi:unnamed protein product [marine sediment metagenome]|uniref:DUF4064 domain-containing protein n=1 Tax=marine sediment metagenome TaxID=412755 RepID=X1K2Q9_9ZZZZ